MTVNSSDERLGIDDFVHPDHLQFFLNTAAKLHCEILVRKTGKMAISWIGKSGFTGKAADMKAKTADVDYDARAVAGLVCSPVERPQVFSTERLAKAWKEWGKSEHLVTVPKFNRGFDDTVLPRGCRTPYMLQNNPDHPYYGAVARVDMGLLRPHYVHGDYDLYDIIDTRGGKLTAKHFEPSKATPGYLVPTVTHSGMSRKDIENARVKNFESELSFRVATEINVAIAMSGGDILGALMVNHGEQILLGSEGIEFDPVLVVKPVRENGSQTQILADKKDHIAFYSVRFADN